MMSGSEGMANLQTLWTVGVLLVLAACETAPLPLPPPPPVSVPLEPDLILTPAWAERAPTSADVMRVYPPAALRAGVTSRVRLVCDVLDDWTLGCEQNWEEAPGYGFGEAAMIVSRLFVVKRDNALGVEPGERVALPIRFVLSD